MAKVFSHSVYKGSGSVGATYYRKSRGRTILCQKPGERPAQFHGLITEERCIMACIAAFAAMHAQSIMNSFNRTKYGSYRNYFTKVNYAALKEAFLIELVPQMLLEKAMPTPEQIEMAVENYAVANPSKIYRIKKSGYPIVMLEDGWDDADDPIAQPIISSIEGDMDSDFNLKSIVLTGENLNASIGFELKSPTSIDVQLLSGVAMVTSKGKRLVYSVSGNVPVIGTKILQARYGQSIIGQQELQGDDREYVHIYAVASPEDGGSVLGDGMYPVGGSAQLSAVAAAGYTFQKWTKGGTDISTDPTISVEVTEEATYTAVFNAPAAPHTVSLTAGNNGKVKIGDGQPGTTATATVEDGGTVQISAVANSGFVFQKWSDNNMQNPRTFTNVVEDITLTATFESED